MRSLLLSLLLGATVLLLASAADTAAPVEVKTTPAAGEDAPKASTAAPAAEEKKVDTTAAPAEEVKTTQAPKEEAKPTAPAEEKVDSTAAPNEEKKDVKPAADAEEKKEEKKETAAPKEEEKKVESTAAPVAEVKSTPASEAKVETTAAPAEEKKEENRAVDEVKASTSAPAVEEKAASTAAPKEEKEEDKATVAPGPKKLVMPLENAEKAKEETALLFDRSLLGHKVADKVDLLKRRKEIFKKLHLTKDIVLPSSITPEEVATVISDGEPAAEEKKKVLTDPVPEKKDKLLFRPFTGKPYTGKPFTGKPKPLVLPRENVESLYQRLVKNRENGELIKKPLVGDNKPSIGIFDKKPLIGTFDIKPLIAKFDNAKFENMKSAVEKLRVNGFENLRAGRGLINIERIDKIDVTVYTYAKEK